MSNQESQWERDYKRKHGLADHVRIAVPAREAAPPAAGLGDAIARFTQFVGIKPCAGCRRRQAALNRVFPRR